MKNKLIILLLVLFSAVVSVSAQQSIAGHLSDSNGKPVVDATVTLRTSADSVLKRGTVSNEKGEFEFGNIDKGNYILRITYVGHDDYVTNVFVDSANIALPAIVLYPSNTTLQQVVVTARKPLIVKKAGKTIINIESSVYSKGENSYRLFNIIPGVQSDESGNINYRGEMNVKVYVDNRKIQLSGRQIMDYLKSIPSESIKSFEVSTVPGVEYDAENSGIIINITLKEIYKYGLSGTVYSNYEQAKYAGFGNGVLLNYRVGKFNFQGNYGNNTGKSFSEYIEKQQFKNQPLYFGQDETSIDNVTINNPKFGFDYNITDRQIIGADYEVSTWNLTTVGQANTQVKKSMESAVVDSMFFTNNRKDMNLKNHIANFFYRNKLDSLGSKIDAGYNYVGYRNNVNSNIYSEFFLPDKTPSRPSENIWIDNPLKIDVHTANLDIEKVFKSGYDWKVGSKYQHSVTDNNIIYFTGVEPNRKLDLTRSNNFNYNENILAFYSSLAKDWGKWSFNAGLRTERTDYNGKSVTTGEAISNQRWDFFPNIYVQRKFNPKNVLSFSYGRRISRPSYQLLNPFEDVEDPYLISKGNPALVPYFSNNLELSYLLASKYSITASYSVTKGIINNIYQTQGNTNVIVSTYGNVNDQRDYGISISAPFTITKWWQVNSFLYAGNTSIKLNNRDGMVKEKTHVYFQVNNRISLPKKYYLEVFGNYLYNAFYSIYDLGPQGIINFSVKKSFLNDHLTLTVSANDPFNVKRINFDIDETNFHRQYQSFLPIRKLSVGISYSFFKGKKSPGREYIESNSQDAQDRLNK